MEFKKVVDQVPQLVRGKVWCIKCGKSLKVDSVKCMSFGWPICCGSTMTIDSPKERRDLNGR